MKTNSTYVAKAAERMGHVVNQHTVHDVIHSIQEMLNLDFFSCLMIAYAWNSK